MSERRRREDGFTLLEILVALVVFGLLMAGLAQGVRFGLLAWHAQMHAIDTRDELDAVDRTLRHMIEAMYPGSGTESANVEGLPNAVAFTTTLPLAAGMAPVGSMAGRMSDVGVLVDGSQRLLLRWTPHLHAVLFLPPPLPQQAELLRGVVRLEIQYWLPTPPSGGVWLNAWTASGPPGLIRIHLVFAPGDPRRWPDIIAAPMRQ